MTTLTFKGNPIQTNGQPPKVGEQAPDIKLVGTDLKEISLADFKGRRVLFNIVPSIDTSVCSLQLKTFSKKVAHLSNIVLLFASLDLPFAHKRFCATEGIDNAITASDYRYHSIADHYGLKIVDGPLNGLYARAVFFLDEHHSILYRDIVKDVSHEPDYDLALTSLTAVDK